MVGRLPLGQVVAQLVNGSVSSVARALGVDVSRVDLGASVEVSRVLAECLAMRYTPVPIHWRDSRARCDDVDNASTLFERVFCVDGGVVYTLAYTPNSCDRDPLELMKVLAEPPACLRDGGLCRVGARGSGKPSMCFASLMVFDPLLAINSPVVNQVYAGDLGIATRLDSLLSLMPPVYLVDEVVWEEGGEAEGMEQPCGVYLPRLNAIAVSKRLAAKGLCDPLETLAHELIHWLQHRVLMLVDLERCRVFTPMVLDCRDADGRQWLDTLTALPYRLRPHEVEAFARTGEAIDFLGECAVRLRKVLVSFIGYGV